MFSGEDWLRSLRNMSGREANSISKAGFEIVPTRIRQDDSNSSSDNRQNTANTYDQNQDRKDEESKDQLSDGPDEADDLPF